MERRAKNDAYRFYRQFILRYWCRKASPPPAQIALRQHIQRGIVIIPKSVHKDRMKQNLIFSTLHWLMQKWTHSTHWMKTDLCGRSMTIRWLFSMQWQKIKERTIRKSWCCMPWSVIHIIRGEDTAKTRKKVIVKKCDYFYVRFWI